MGHQREFFRIALERSGTIQRGSLHASCEVVDLTEKGVQLKTNLTVEVGETLQLRFDLAPGAPIHCTILVARVSLGHIGARISDISPDDQERLSQFVEQFIALNLGGF